MKGNMDGYQVTFDTLKRAQLTTQQYKTLKGQLLHGDTEEARRGLERIERRHHG